MKKLHLTSILIGITLLFLLSLSTVARADSVVITGIVPLAISNVASSGVTATGATITWQTNGGSTSQVFYDTVQHALPADYARSTSLDSTQVSQHSQNLAGLTASTTYYYRTQSTFDGLAAFSTEMSFTTLASSGGGVSPTPTPTPTPTPSPPPPAGGGGGGGGVPTAPGVTDVRPKTINGRFTVTTYASSADKNVELQIDEGTQGENSDGTPLTTISITPMSSAPGAPSDGQALALLYDFGPTGAKYDKPITITMNYDPAKLPAGTTESSLFIAWFDTTNNKWVALPSTVDTAAKKITAQVTHFTAFGAMATVAAATPAPVPPSSTTTSPPTPVPTLPTSKPATFFINTLRVTPSEIILGDSVTANVTFSNTGDLRGSYGVNFMLNDTLFTTRTITVGGHSTDSILVTLSPETPGDYTLAVDHLKSNFIVKAPQPSTPLNQPPSVLASPSTPPASSPAASEKEPSAPFNWILIIGISLGVCIMLLVAVAVVRKGSRR